MWSDNKSTDFDYKAFYNEAPVGYFTTNASHIIINANQFFFDLVQRNAGEVIGKMGLQDFLSIGGKMYFQTHYFPILQVSGKIQEINLEIQRKDKTRVPILINTNKSDKEESTVFHSVVFNISQRNLFEKELIVEKKNAEKLTQQLKLTNEKIQLQADIIGQQNKSLERLNSVKDKFFSIIAHDIRGPLSELYAFISIVQDHIDTISKQELKDMSYQMKESLSNTVELADSLINWAQSQMKEYKVTSSIFYIEEAVKEVIGSNRTIAIKKRLNLSYTLNGSPKIKADKNHLLFIIRNLMMNAIKFTPAGGSIKVHCLQIEGNKLKMAISDDGIGMSEEAVSTIFDDQMKNSTEGTNGEKGNGIGLILVKEFVAMNDGTIEVFSQENKGTTFLLTFNSNY